MVKSLPSSAGDVGVIPGLGTKIPRAAGQLGPRATATELAHRNYRAHVPQTTEPMRPGARAPQLERENPHAATREKPTHRKKEHTHCNKRDPVCLNEDPTCRNEDPTQPKEKL